MNGLAIHRAITQYVTFIFWKNLAKSFLLMAKILFVQRVNHGKILHMDLFLAGLISNAVSSCSSTLSPAWISNDTLWGLYILGLFIIMPKTLQKNKHIIVLLRTVCVWRPLAADGTKLEGLKCTSHELTCLCCMFYQGVNFHINISSGSMTPRALLVSGCYRRAN